MKIENKPDATLKDFWHNNERFADLFSQVFFHGEDALDPARLSDQDTDESAVFEYNDAMASMSRRRDLIKEYGEDAEFVLIGLEAQMRVHYAMPVRTMMQDSIRYVRISKRQTGRTRH